MATHLDEARDNFIQGVSRIANFWGFPKAMGAIFGAVYLSPQALTLDDIVEQVGVSKGAVSTNVRSLERLGVVHKQIKIGDRKDYYIAETDFWKIVKGILKEREKNEFDLAIRSVGESLRILEDAPRQADPTDPTEQADPTDPTASTEMADPAQLAEMTEKAEFYKQRMLGLKKFFDTLDTLVAGILAADNFRAGILGEKNK